MCRPKPCPKLPSEQIVALQNELATQLKAKGLRTIVQMMAPGALERTEFKAKRIIDKRDLYDRITHKGLKFYTAGRSRKGNDIADIADAGDQHQQAFEAQPKTAVRHGAEFT